MYKKLSNNPWGKTFNFPDFCYWDNVFNDEELKLLNETCSKLKLEKGRIGDVEIRTDVRNTNTTFIDRDENNIWIFERFNYIIESINEDFYNFDLIGYDTIQYSEYDSKELGEYNFHMDIGFGQIDLMRKLSVAFLLDDKFQGGEFEMNISKENNAISIPTQKNRAIFFPSFLIHRVKPVTEGIRKSLVIWVLGLKFR